MSMEIRGVLAVLFAAVFGLIFIVAGTKRMLWGGPKGKGAEAIFWGAVGIIIGVAMILAVAWFCFGPPQQLPDDQSPF